MLLVIRYLLMFYIEVNIYLWWIHESCQSYYVCIVGIFY